MPLDPPTDPIDDSAFESVPLALKTTMLRRGFVSLTPIQRAVLDAESEGKNLRISSQTGSGKTVALGLALADSLARAAGEQDRPQGPRALVIVPTRELAAQVREELAFLYGELKGVQVEVVTGGTDLGRDRKNLRRCPRLVVGTPGRMLDHIRTGALNTADVEHVVLDEADQMLDMGFREELEGIVDALPEDRRSHMVSATFPPQLKRLAERFQRDALHLEGTVLGAANTDIEHTAHVVLRHDRYAAVVNLLLSVHGERCLVFVRRRVDAAELSEKLSADGFAALPFSGDLPQAQRTRTLNAFRAGIVNTLVCTDVAARGIDVPEISAVIHGDVPENAEVYTHRSGRTGRAGKSGKSLLILQPNARRHVSEVFRRAGIDGKWTAAPTPKQINKVMTKRARRELHARIEQDSAAIERQSDYAKQLLGERDPVQVVAALLEMAQPELPRAPMTLDEVSQARPMAPSRQPANGRPARGQDNRDFARFSINWGGRSGATPARIVAHVCRRTGIGSQELGAIAISDQHTSFEVSAAQAAEFERRASCPDAKDPNLRITKEAPGASANRFARRPGKPNRGFRPGPHGGRPGARGDDRRSAPRPR